MWLGTLWHNIWFNWVLSDFSFAQVQTKNPRGADECGSKTGPTNSHSGVAKDPASPLQTGTNAQRVTSKESECRHSQSDAADRPVAELPISSTTAKADAHEQKPVKSGKSTLEEQINKVSSVFLHFYNFIHIEMSCSMSFSVLRYFLLFAIR